MFVYIYIYIYIYTYLHMYSMYRNRTYSVQVSETARIALDASITVEGSKLRKHAC